MEGNDIVVAGAGVAGLAFALNLQKQWGDNVRPPRVIVYDRDKRELDLRRQGYSQTLSGMYVLIQGRVADRKTYKKCKH